MNIVENQPSNKGDNKQETKRKIHDPITLNTACRQFNDLIIYNRLKHLPKVDIHRHFEGSLRLSTLSEIARMFKMDLPADPTLLAPMVQMVEEVADFQVFLAKFGTLRKFYQSPTIIKRIAYEVVADAAMDNVKYLELRFSPQALAAEKGFPLEDVTDWVIESVREAAEDFNIIVNLIITLVRHDPMHLAERVARIAMDRKDYGIVALDLAGDEVHFPADLFTGLFREAKQEGLKVTIHAGEWTGADSVRQAVLDIGADRIGHGVRALEDDSLMQILKERKIPLEMSLASNEQTGSVTSIIDHPLKEMWKRGIKVTLNTDDPTICNVTMTDELAFAADYQKMNFFCLYDLTWNALEAGFMLDSQRDKLKQYVRHEWAQVDEQADKQTF